MQYISPEEFKKKYGTIQPKKPSFVERTKEGAKQGFEKIKAGGKQVNKQGANPYNLVSGGLKIGAGAIESAFSPLTAAVEPAVAPTLGRGVNYAADKLSSNPTFQKFATSKAGQVTGNIVEDIGNLNTMVGAVAGPRAGLKYASRLGTGAVRAGEQTATKVGQAVSTSPLRGMARGMLPTRERMINSEIASAFDLTAGDLKNIYTSTGHDVGSFVAKNNLIAGNVDDSVKLIDNFKTQNYNKVRESIGQVQKAYSPTAVPRYTEALQELIKGTADTPGLQKATAEIGSLLKKKTITLNDVQRVKELMDDHFSLYKVTGDVKEGLAKKGLTNIRRDIREFIEKEVKDNTGVDIKTLNNNVATSRGLLDAIETRSTRGLTRYSVGLRDLGLFAGGSVTGSPLFGAALVFGKKLLENPTVRLRIAKFLSGLDEAKVNNIQKTLQSGKIPPEFKQFIKKKASETNDALNEVTPGLSIKGVSDDLTTEARKYKSAEEFVSKIQGSATQYGDYTPQFRHLGMEDYKNVAELGAKPEKMVTIYRGIDDTTGKIPRKINDGDFVTTDFDSAMSYAGKDNVVSMKVPAKTLYTDAIDDFKTDPFYIGSEYVYTTQKVQPLTKSQLTDIWNKANRMGQVREGLNESTPGLSTKNTAKYNLEYTDQAGATKTLKNMTKQDAMDWTKWLKQNKLKFTVKLAGAVATAGAATQND